ncbi:hypothetical protein RI129_011013 [Pyrocoelia pectoralis]|uniref:Protein FAM98A n=1 Tax=Pyrocoelia pectoralis TaxID=417401 RepID=A0AAN7ZE78_9COLE
MSEMAIVPEFGDLSLTPSRNSNEMDSNLQSELLKSIKHIGYEESFPSENQLSSALAEGPKNIEYTKLIGFLSNELRELCGLDECVNAITSPDDSSTFIMEISSFLKELGCPYERLVQGHVSDRLSTIDDRYLLIKYLISELLAARILRENQPGKRLDLKLKESEQASDLRKILQILGYPQPPKNITMQILLKKLIPSIQALLSKAPKDLIGNPIFNGTLSEEQWETLEKINEDLHDEYLIRREMLLKRLDCTIQSFQWSDKTKGKDSAFQQKYTEKRKELRTDPDVGIADLLAARDDVAIIEKTSNASVRKNTKSSINRVIIGAVPDRGGRTSEQAPPPPEMPPWQQRNAGPSGGGGPRGGFNNTGSNFSRGGGGNSFSQGGGYSNNYSDSNYSKGSGGRGGGGGNYSNSRGAFDSAGSYGDSSRGYSQSDYSRGGGNDNYSKGRGGYSRDSSGYGGRESDNYSRDNQGYSRDSNVGYSRDNSGYSRSNSGYSQDSNRGYSQGGFDSAGSYGGYNQEYQEPKRAKTYDQFQQNRSTYADQYVQESEHNMQYQSRDRDNRNRGRGGRSNYNRGGGSYH